MIILDSDLTEHRIRKSEGNVLGWCPGEENVVPVFFFGHFQIVRLRAVFRTQREIAVEVCKGKSKPSEIDWNRASELIKAQLGENVYEIKYWYDRSEMAGKL